MKLIAFIVLASAFASVAAAKRKTEKPHYEVTGLWAVAPAAWLVLGLILAILVLIN